jgi:DNA helicase-2/ATP-dependent DNA helicase PcrA
VFTQSRLDKILKNFFGFYLRFLFVGGLEEYEDFDENIPSGCISFLTIHQSKGLEFPITVVGSMGAVPRKSYDDFDVILQNEYYNRPPFEPIEHVKYYDFWRLYYTAFSRAQNLLVLTGREHSGAGSVPSAYFREYWEATPSWDNCDLTKLELAEVKPTNIKHEYAFTSNILLYEDCPRKYKFYKELEFTEIRQGAMIGGTLLHETIEDIHRAVLRGEEQALTDANISAWFNSNYNQLVKSQHGFLQQAQRDALLAQVLRYRDANHSKWHLIKEAEVDVSLVKEDYILKGKIDLIRGENGTVELVDFKSGEKPDVNTSDPFKRKILNQYRRQLEVYAYIIEQRTGQKISKMHLYYPREDSGNPKISFPYIRDYVDHTISSFDEVVKKIEKKDFSMENHLCSEKTCRECDLRHYCHKL